LESPAGPLEQFAGSRETAISTGIHILDIEFKQYRAPMFFQSALRACDEVNMRLSAGGVTSSPRVRRMTLNVTAFSAGYAGADRPGSSIADVRRIVLDHVVHELHWELVEDLIWEVRPLPGGSASDGSLDVELVDGLIEKADLVTRKANDTREVRRIHGSSQALESVLRGATELARQSGVEAINKAWQDLVVAKSAD
jgi:hypothetical protein